MNLSQLRPISELNKDHGFKILCYGKPGIGKTPLIATAPNPVVLFTEPGTKSLGSCNHIPGYIGATQAQIADFINWVLQSNEAKRFDTFCIDSVSEIAEIVLADELKKNKDGRKAYGEMAKTVYAWLRDLYHLPGKHLYLIAKEETGEEYGIAFKRPYFPGKELHVRVPHLFDALLRLEEITVNQQRYQAFLTKGNTGALARIRHYDVTRFSEYEPANLSQLIAKAQ